jgi:hypothetical protein
MILQHISSWCLQGTSQQVVKAAADASDSSAGAPAAGIAPANKPPPLPHAAGTPAAGSVPQQHADQPPAGKDKLSREPPKSLPHAQVGRTGPMPTLSTHILSQHICTHALDTVQGTNVVHSAKLSASP